MFICLCFFFFFFSSRRRHTRLQGDWSSDVCSSDLSPVFYTRRLQSQKAITMKSVCAHPVAHARRLTPPVRFRPGVLAARQSSTTAPHETHSQGARVHRDASRGLPRARR